MRKAASNHQYTQVRQILWVEEVSTQSLTQQFSLPHREVHPLQMITSRSSSSSSSSYKHSRVA